jgi:hypothetical protein
LAQAELEAFWKKWGRWLIAGTLAGLAAFGGWLYWQDQREIKAGEDAEMLQSAYDAAQTGKSAEAAGKLETLSKAEADGYRATALLTKAATTLQNGDAKGAAAIYATVANDQGLDPIWRDLALIRQTTIEFDTIKPDVIVTRLKPLAVRGKPWFGSAGEMVAIAYLKQGNQALAAKMFSEMSKDEQVPETIRNRAVEMASSLDMTPQKQVTESVSK